ncbi:MAG: FAD-binding protein, partial [Actinomycetota bacterium]
MSTARVWRNWAGTASCAPQAIHRPADAAGVATIVAAAARRGERVKVAGSGHSFTGAACTDGHVIRLSEMKRVVSVDRDARRVTVQAGIRIDELAAALAEHGLALPSLGDIGYQTVAGAIATGTHGAGLRYAGIAAQVRALEMVLADGSTLSCSAESQPEVFHAARVGLGALGAVVTVTMECEDAFTLHALEEPVRLPELLERFDDIASSQEHAEFFWFPHTDRALLKRNNRTDQPPRPPGRARAWFNDVFLANRVFDLACRAGRAQPAWIPGIARIAGRALSRREYSDRSDRVFT